MQTTFAAGTRREYRLRLRGGEAVLGGRTWVMGVLNVTPDSFSDGGRFLDAGAALAQGLALFEEGVARLRDATAALADADTRVQQLVESIDGSLTVADQRS